MPAVLHQAQPKPQPQPVFETHGLGLGLGLGLVTEETATVVPTTVAVPSNATVRDYGEQPVPHDSKFDAQVWAPVIAVAAQPWRHASRSGAVRHPVRHVLAAVTTPRAQSARSIPHEPLQATSALEAPPSDAARQPAMQV